MTVSRPEARITGCGPKRSASPSPDSRAAAIPSAKAAKVTPVMNGLAPLSSRIRSADHSSIAPSIRSAPIGTRQSSTSAAGGR